MGTDAPYVTLHPIQLPDPKGRQINTFDNRSSRGTLSRIYEHVDREGAQEKLARMRADLNARLTKSVQTVPLNNLELSTER